MSKKLILYPALFIILFLMNRNVYPQKSEKEIRTKISINKDWGFCYIDKEFVDIIKLRNEKWENISIPHTWNNKDAFDDSLNYKRGTGWYKKELPQNLFETGERFFLYFEAANQTTDVFINNTHIGNHIGGYTAFAFELTEHINYTTPNYLYVKVNNEHNDNIPPLNADFTFYGGIYRDIWLITTNEIHFDILDYASPGIFIKTETCNKDFATLSITGTVVNQYKSSNEVSIHNNIYDKRDSLIFSQAVKLEIEGGNKRQFNIENIEINKPELWSPQNPYLYKIKTELYVGGKVIDEANFNYGLRFFEFSGEDGFKLNGEKINLYGTNRHQDLFNKGNALTNEEHIRDVDIIKENGFNFLRLAHYPQDNSVLNRADEVGLILWEEIPIVNMITISDTFYSNCEQMLIEMIKQHYNHPSVLMWGFMNEVLLRKPEPLPQSYSDEVLKLAKRLNKKLHELDPSRVSVMAQSYGEIDDGTRVGDVTDVIGFNLYFGWYYNEFEDFGKTLDEYHSKHPERPIIISEYGAGSDERIHSTNPISFDFSTEYQQMYHESSFKQLLERDYLAGAVIWIQFDFGSDYRQDSKPAINQKGIYYFDRTPKDISYYYKAALTKEPFIHIAVNDWRNRSNDKIQPIKIYSNINHVELFVNDKSYGRKKTTNNTAEWNVELEEGKNLLLAKGIKNSKNILSEEKINFYSGGNIFSENNNHYLAVNCGSNYEFHDENGIIWLTDQKHKSGGWGYNGGTQRITHHTIYETNSDPLYQTANEGEFSYHFDLPKGDYAVSLLFCANNSSNENERKFIILINNEHVTDEIDLIKEVGKHKPLIKSFNVSVEEKGLEIKSKIVSGTATISGILIRKVK